MKDKSKILPKIVLIILVITLISTLILSSVYAKYVSDKTPDPAEARPAAFELVMNNSDDGKIEVNFAADGEPGSPIGHTEAEKYYDFTVKTSNSEVAADYMLTVTFDKKLADMIRQAREDRFKDGIWCDYEVQIKNSEGEYESISALGTESGSNALEWKYVSTIKPHQNPDGTFEGEVYYRLKMIVYNNTLMPSTGNGSDYVLSTNGINIEVSSKQINPDYVGEYAGK